MKAIDTTKSAFVTSAVALTASEKKQLEEVLSGSVPGPITYSYQVDADVLGGVKVEVGDLILDSTVASQLKKVKTILEK